MPLLKEAFLATHVVVPKHDINRIKYDIVISLHETWSSKPPDFFHSSGHAAIDLDLI
jgi:hypothetical protein